MNYRLDEYEHIVYNIRVFVDWRAGKRRPRFFARRIRNVLIEEGRFEGMKDMLPKDSEIAALLPEYTAEGDVTRVVLTNGTALVLRRTMRATLSALARRRCKDVTHLRRWAARYTRRRLNNPIAASADLVLVPVKTRRPRVCGDNTMAHINVAAIGAGKKERARRKTPARKLRPAVIALVGGVSVRALWSERTTQAHIGDARRIRAELIREQEEAVLRRLNPILG